MPKRVLWSAVWLAIAWPAVGGAQVPIGPEFQVNTYITGYQGEPSVAADANGNFVVVWASDGQAGSAFDVFGQRYNAFGQRQGGEFLVNSYTGGYGQRDPTVASDASGNFVVVWTSSGPTVTGGNDVFGQRYDASGTPQGGEFRVNTYTTNAQDDSAVASDANGNFVVVWTSDQQDGPYTGVFGQRYDASGTPRGGEFRASSETTSRQDAPAISLDASGNFVVVWQDNYGNGIREEVFGRRFNASGTGLGSEFRANSYTASVQAAPVVASDADGDFVVVWHSYFQDGDLHGVFGQRYAATGAPRGGEFRINSYTTSLQGIPAVASRSNGDFVVTWTSYFEDGNDLGTFGRRYDASGISQGGAFQVNSYTTAGQVFAAVAWGADARFVVAWGGRGNQDGSGQGVFGQRFATPDLIFEDGFE